MEQVNYENQLIESFNQMWDKYPEPVQLIHRSFRILAVNESCRLLGGVAGVICCADNDCKPHPGCRAMLALKTNEAQVVAREREGTQITGYWIPVAGATDYYIHFGNGMKDYMNKLAKQKDGELCPGDN